MFCTLSQSSTDASKPKICKPNSDLGSDSFHKINKYGDKIKPIPLIYKKIGYKGDPLFLCKFSARGYRCVSRVQASGEFTVEILKKMNRSSYLKMIRSIDFDPYLCDTSGLKSLAEALTRFKGFLHSLSLVFRRFNERDELKKFSPCLARLNKMENINIKFPSPKGLEMQDLSDLNKYCQMLSSIKSAYIIFDSPKDVIRNVTKIESLLKNCKKIERIGTEVYFNHINPSQFENYKRKEPKKVFLKDLKSVSVKWAFKTGWSALFDGNDLGNGFHIYLKDLPKIVNPTSFSFKLDKMQALLAVLEELANTLPLLTNLRFVSIELNKIKLTQFEMMILAKGFVDCKQIKHLTFKYLDNTNISMIDLLQFIMVLAKYSSFPKFDLFFRKIFVQEWQTSEAKRQLDEIKNIKYILTKQTIHIQKVMISIEDGM